MRILSEILWGTCEAMEGGEGEGRGAVDALVIDGHAHCEEAARYVHALGAGEVCAVTRAYIRCSPVTARAVA